MKKKKVTHCFYHPFVEGRPSGCPICNLEKRIEALEDWKTSGVQNVESKEPEKPKEPTGGYVSKDLGGYLSFMFPEKCIESIWIIRDSIRELALNDVERNCDGVVWDGVYEYAQEVKKTLESL